MTPDTHSLRTHDTAERRSQLAIYVVMSSMLGLLLLQAFTNELIARAPSSAAAERGLPATLYSLAKSI